MNNAKYIVLEGVDFSGKTTIAKLLRKRMNEEFVECNAVCIGALAATKLGLDVRRVLMTHETASDDTRTCLNFAAFNHTAEFMGQSDSWFIVDRWVNSNIVYQPDTNEELRTTLTNLLYNKSTRPRMTFILTVDYETAMARMAKEGEEINILDTNDETEFNRRREAYLKFSGVMDTVIIDAAQEPSDIVESIINILKCVSPFFTMKREEK